MFLYNLYGHWNLFSQAESDGVIVHTVGRPSDRADGRAIPRPGEGFVLIDPEFYLATLDPADCGRSTERLATYPWHTDTSVPWPPLEDLDQPQRRAVLESCLAWQQSQGASRLIIPTPLISDPTARLDNFLAWVDDGLDIAQQMSVPSLITVALSDSCIGTHVQRVLDNVTARDPHGVYFLFETSRSSGAHAVSYEVACALLDACYVIGVIAGKEMFVNFADTFGLVCLAAGATAFAAGYERKARRLDFEYFEERGGGGAFPKFLSLTTTCRYRPERDMQRIRDQRLLRLLSNDRSIASSPLFTALDAGRDVGAVVEWRESRNNVSLARAHLIEMLARTARHIGELTTLRERVGWVLDWLQDAERNVTYLNDRFEGDPLDDDGRHITPWRRAFEEFVARYGIL